MRAGELDAKYKTVDWLEWYAWDSPSGFWVPRPGCNPPEPEKTKGKTWGGKGWLAQQKDMFMTISEHRQMKVIVRDNPGLITDLLENKKCLLAETKKYIEDHGGVIS